MSGIVVRKILNKFTLASNLSVNSNTSISTAFTISQIYKGNRTKHSLTTEPLLAFLPLFGLMGAAVATVLGIGITKLVILFKVKLLVESDLKSFLPWSRIAKIAAAAGGAGVAALILQATVTLPVVIRLGLSATLFSVAYGALVWSMEVLERTEKDTILGWLQSCGGSNKYNLLFRLRRSI